MTFYSQPRHPITGRRIRLHARTQRELDAYLHRLDTLRTELKLGMRTIEQVDVELRHLMHGPATVERAAVGYLARASLAKNTKSRVRSLVESKNGGAHLAPLLGRPLASLDASVLAPWLEGLARAKLHPTTIAMIWRTLRSIVRHGAERGWIGALPWGAWRPRLSRAPRRPPREATRTLEELARLLLAARELDDRDWNLTRAAMGTWDREAMIACAALLGLRQGELGGLRWSDVGWGPPIEVLVARQWQRDPLKMGAQPMRVQALEELAEILMRYRARLRIAGRYRDGGPVFPRRDDGRWYTRGAVLSRLNLRAAIRRAQLPHLASWSAHSLRDSFVTLEVLASGGDLVRAAARSRHASVASLARYLHALSRSCASPATSHLPSVIAGDAPPRLNP